MSKYCPRCGAATERNAAFCQNCGGENTSKSSRRLQIQTQIHIIKITVLFHHNNQEDFILNSQTKRNLLWYSKLLPKIKSAAVFWLIWGILCAIIGIITVCVGAAASSSISGRFI